MTHFDIHSPEAEHAQCAVCEKSVANNEWFARIEREGQTLMLCSEPCADRFYARKLPLLRQINLLAMLESSPHPGRQRPAWNES